MDEQTRRKEATLKAMRQIHEATIKHSKNPERVAEARKALADMDR